MTLLPAQVTLAGDPVTVDGPSRAELDVTDRDTFFSVTEGGGHDVIVHAAAFTDVGGAEKNREPCWRANDIGTRNAAAAAARIGAKLIHRSTDYVFWGDAGAYAE